MKQPKRISTMEGVTVSVVPSDKTFSVFVTIDEGCNLTKKRKNQFFSIKFHVDKKKHITQELLTWNLLHVEYPNFLVNFKETLLMPDGVDATISLSPEFYFSDSLLNIYQKRRNKRLKNTQRKRMRKAQQKTLDRFYREIDCGSCQARPSSQATINGRPATNFSRNNVFIPYQGGGCSSK